MVEQRIPFFRPSISDDDVAAVADSVRSGWITSGPNVGALEQELAEYCGAGRANVVNSCTAALHLTLRAWGIGPGDEVITTPYTFVSTVTTIVHTGARPVLVDVRSADANIDPGRIAEAVTTHTRAIVPVHFAGLPCDLDSIYGVARSCGAKVLEDAAHALGASYGGCKIGGAGDAAALSFYATKNMTTGEGGALVTNDPELSDRVRTLTLHGMTRDAWRRYDAGGAWRYDVEEMGFKDNLSDFAAALGRSQLRRLDAMKEDRRRLAARYLANLGDLENIILPDGGEGGGHAWHLFVIRVRDRAGIDRSALIRGLADRGVGTSVHFIPVHMFSAYRRLGLWHEGQFPMAERFFRGAVSLPLYPGLTDSDVDEVCQAIRDVMNTT